MNSKSSIRNFFHPVNTQKKTKLTNSCATSFEASNDSTAFVEKEIFFSAEQIVTTNRTDSSNWSHLNYLEHSWKNQLKNEFTKPYFLNLKQFVDEERQKHTVYPSVEDTFSAFRFCPYEAVKVVIIGQDPYHGPNQAHGLAFSVLRGVQNPPSLQNIFKEAINDVKILRPNHGNLEYWCNQGVLLLNTCLTVRKGEPNSHQKRGWELFTDAVIRELSYKNNLVYLLWGKPAQAKCINIDRSKNVVITSSHPSPLGAMKTNEPFISSKCFSRCNDALISYGKDPIDWNVK